PLYTLPLHDALPISPWDLWFVALPALALVTALVTSERRAARRIWLAWAGGAGYGAAALFWIVEPFLIEIGRHGWMAPFALFLMRSEEHTSELQSREK